MVTTRVLQVNNKRSRVRQTSIIMSDLPKIVAHVLESVIVKVYLSNLTKMPTKIMMNNELSK